MDKTPERERRRRHPQELIGPHSDVYSLGKSIEQGTKLLGLQAETLRLLRKTTLESETKPRLELVYTSDLWNLIFSCQNEDARYRPKLHYLYRETKIRMEHCRAFAQAEEEEALSKGIPGCFHSNVLFTRVDRKRFETDPVFQSNYRKANLAPVWEMSGPLPSQDMTQTEPSFSLGDENLFNVNLKDAAHAKGVIGQPKKGLSARVGRKIEKTNKEKRKGGARVQQGFRRLLSKMNFFS